MDQIGRADILRECFAWVFFAFIFASGNSQPLAQFLAERYS